VLQHAAGTFVGSTLEAPDVSSIPAAALAKALVAVTISLHPAAHHAAQHAAARGTAPLGHRYRVRPGDSLSSIARHRYGTAADWPVLWWANRHIVPDPGVITSGQRLRLPSAHRVRPWLVRAAMAAIPAPRTAAASPPVAPSAAGQTAGGAPGAGSAPITGSTGGVNWSAIAACESSGNWSANTGNGFYGGLQFTEQTWLGYGGGQYAASANLATPAEQIAVAQRVEAGQGIGAWPVCGSRG
jgi:hypothetical protein